MALVAPSKYGKTKIGGNATVHQGDNYVGDNYHFPSVNTIQIVNCDNQCVRLENASPGVLHLPRSRRAQNNISSVDTGMNADQAAHGIFLINKILNRAGAADEHISFPLSDQASQDILTAPSIEKLAQAFQDSSSSKQSLFLVLIDRLRRNTLFPLIANVLPRPASGHCDQLDDLGTALSVRETQPLPVPLVNPVSDMIAVFLAIFTFAYCHGDSANGENQAIVTRQQFRKLPFLAGLIAFAIARYLCLPPMIQALSELGANYIIFQDAFCVERKIPMSHCEHFKMLEAYLSVHLADTTAEPFIKAGQFNLTLGKRNGPVIRRSDWAASGPIKARHRVVMAVFLKKGDARCTECDLILTMSETGQFCCHPCGRFYGNCATLSYWADTSTPQESSKETMEGPTLKRIRSHMLQPPASFEQDNDEYDVDGLKNIDLRISPRPRQPQRTEIMENSLSVEDPSQDTMTPLPSPTSTSEDIASLLASAKAVFATQNFEEAFSMLQQILCDPRISDPALRGLYVEASAFSVRISKEMGLNVDALGYVESAYSLALQLKSLRSERENVSRGLRSSMPKEPNLRELAVEIDSWLESTSQSFEMGSHNSRLLEDFEQDALDSQSVWEYEQEQSAGSDVASEGEHRHIADHTPSIRSDIAKQGSKTSLSSRGYRIDEMPYQSWPMLEVPNLPWAAEDAFDAVEMRRLPSPGLSPVPNRKLFSQRSDLPNYEASDLNKNDVLLVSSLHQSDGEEDSASEEIEGRQHDIRKPVSNTVSVTSGTDPFTFDLQEVAQNVF